METRDDFADRAQWERREQGLATEVRARARARARARVRVIQL